MRGPARGRARARTRIATPSSRCCRRSTRPGGDDRRLIDLDQRIHRHIYRCAHSPFLARTLEEYYVLTLRIWFLALDRVAQLEEAVHEHRELLEAIRDGDATRAEASMRRHVAAFEQAMRTVL